MRWKLAAVVLLVSGCAEGADPATGVLEPGSRAVVVIERDQPRVAGLPPQAHAALWVGRDEGGLSGYRPLAPGVRVTIGDDPGYYETTQRDIDERVKSEARWRDEARSDAEVKARDAVAVEAGKQKPRRHHPPETLSGLRPVRVVVETGEYRGEAGRISRRDLRPIRD